MIFLTLLGIHIASKLSCLTWLAQGADGLAFAYEWTAKHNTKETSSSSSSNNDNNRPRKGATATGRHQHHQPCPHPFLITMNIMIIHASPAVQRATCRLEGRKEEEAAEAEHCAAEGAFAAEGAEEAGTVLRRLLSLYGFKKDYK